MVLFTVYCMRKLHANSPVNRQIQQQTCLHTTEKVRNPAGKCSLFNPLWPLWSVLRVTCVGSTHFCFWLCVFVAWLVHICSTCFQTDEDVSLICFFFFSRCLKWRWVELSSPPCKLPFSILITRAHKQNMKSWKQSTESSVWNECDLQLQRSNVQRQHTENKGFCQNPLLSR